MIKKIKFLIDYFKYLENPIETLQFKFGLKKECVVKLKNTNLKIRLKNIVSLNRLMSLLIAVVDDKYVELLDYIKNIDEDKEIIVVDDIKYINIYNKKFIQNDLREYNICIEEYFTGDQWNMIDFKNRNVIDIGANVADTALYFAKNGATVIAFEPVKHLYELGLKNISLNEKLKENIELINKAVGGKRGKLDITNTTTKSYINSMDDYQIDVITVSDVLNNYNFPADILKMDCEGCEFEIIPNESLNMFKDIIFEHHSKRTGKDYKTLIKKLKEEGFEIDTYHVNASSLKFEDIGIIHAHK